MSRIKFRPQLEALEDRQMLHAGLGHIGHTLPPAALAAPALVASATPQAISADAYFVEAQARAILKDRIIGNDVAHGKLSNPWALSNSLLVLGPSIFNETGNKIEVSYRLQYGDPTQECVVWMVLEGQMQGGDKVYTLTAAGLSGWQRQWFDFWVSPDGFGAYARDRFWRGIHINKFDQNRFVQNVLRQAETILGAPQGSFLAERVTPINGGLEVIIFLGAGQSVATYPNLKFEFRYGDADVKAGWVESTSVENGLIVQDLRVGNHWSFSGKHTYPPNHPLRLARWRLA
jgi:hypothetical protein